MDQNDIRMFLAKHLLNPRKHIASNVKERLAGLHDSEIVIRLNIEYTQHLIKHLAMLPSNDHERLKVLWGFF